MKKISLLLAVIFLHVGISVARAEAPVIFEVMFDSLVNGFKNGDVLSADGHSTGMYVQGATINIGATPCGSYDDRIQIPKDGGGYIQLPELENIASIVLSARYTSSGNESNTGFEIQRKVENNWVKVGELVMSGTACFSDQKITLSVAGNVTLRLIQPGGENTVMVYGGIKVLGMFPPTLAPENSLMPTGSDVVLSTAALTMTFSGGIEKGSGNIQLFKSGVASPVKVIDVTTEDAVINGSTLALSISDITLEAGTQYYVTVDATAVRGVGGGLNFSGITSETDWTFTTSNELSSECDILGIAFANQSSIQMGSTSINVEVENGTNLSTLEATSIALSPGAQLVVPSGWHIDEEWDFSDPVTFTVQAEDGHTTKNYTITVTVKANDKAEVDSLLVSQGTIRRSNDTIYVRGMKSTLVVFASEGSTISFDEQDYPKDSVTLTNIIGVKDLTITAEDGVEQKTYCISGADAGITSLPVAAKGELLGGETQSTYWRKLVETSGWLMNVTGVAYSSAANRYPIRFGTPGDYIMLHCDEAPLRVSFYLRCNNANLTGYKVSLLESADALLWNTVNEITSGIPTGSDFARYEYDLNENTRYVKWIFSDYQGSGTMMLDELGISKYDPAVQSDEKDITSLSLLATNSKTYEGVIEEDTVTIMAPASVSLENAIATFTISSKASIKIGGVDQVSGTTINDFTNGLSYTVAAEDGTTKVWVVRNARLEASANGLFEFDFSTGRVKKDNYVLVGDDVEKLTFTSVPVQSEHPSCGARTVINNGNTLTFPVVPELGHLSGGRWGVGTSNNRFVIEKKYADEQDWVLVDTIKTLSGCSVEPKVYINAERPVQVRLRAFESSISLYGVFTIYPLDTVPTRLQGHIPFSGSQNVVTNLSSLEMTFSKNVKSGAGEIKIYNALDNSEHSAYDVGGVNVEFVNNQVVVSLATELDVNTTYYVNIPSTAILDESGRNPFAGISDNSAWTFKTRAQQVQNLKIFDIALDTLQALTSSGVEQVDSIYTNVGENTGMKLFCAETPGSTKVEHGASARCGYTDRISLSKGASYVELPSLKNPATLSFTYATNSTNEGRMLVVYKQVDGGDWVSVDTLIPPTTSGSTSACSTAVLNISTHGNVRLRIANESSNSSVLIWGGNITVMAMDMEAPELFYENPLHPACGNTDVPLNIASLSMRFNKEIVKGTGNIYLYEGGNSTPVKVVDVTTEDVTVVDSVLHISIAGGSSLERGTEYYVTMDTGVVKNKNGVAYAGISGNTEWLFTTRSTASDEKNILSIGFVEQDSVKILESSVNVWLKYTKVNNLKINTLILSDAAVVKSPAGWSNGVDFTNPVTFTIEAEDKSTKDYTITVYVTPNHEVTINNILLGEASVWKERGENRDTINVRTVASDLSSVDLKLEVAGDASIKFRESNSVESMVLTNVDFTELDSVK
ncbi:MAG: Ig-like domain-containing protein, partial [Prevotellaceae bacterium]|nr:Ig-like domain-containing protein [Prevotellaceae bacterium]